MASLVLNETLVNDLPIETTLSPLKAQDSDSSSSKVLPKASTDPAAGEASQTQEPCPTLESETKRGPGRPKKPLPYQGPLAPNQTRSDKDGLIRKRTGRPRNNQRGFRPTGKYYDLVFERSPSGRIGRRYKITFTSMSRPDAVFETDLISTSLGSLLRMVAREIGKLRLPIAARHFSLTLQAYPESTEMVEANVGIQEAEPVEGERPLTVLPSFDEGLEL
jgi:hypothetical protein